MLNSHAVIVYERGLERTFSTYVTRFDPQFVGLLSVTTALIGQRRHRISSCGFVARISTHGFVVRIRRADSSHGFVARIYRKDSSHGFVVRIRRTDSSHGFVVRVVCVCLAVVVVFLLSPTL